MSLPSPQVDRLLASSPGLLPLTQTSLRPSAEACHLDVRDAPALFPGARHQQAAFAGLLLRLGCWSESHTVAQDIQTPAGSYWHAITHRMEPDSANAAYWFRRVGDHSIFPDLLQAAFETLQAEGPAHWRLKAKWDPFLFVEWCDEARETGGIAEAAAIQIQMAEWQLLFHWCSASKLPHS